MCLWVWQGQWRFVNYKDVKKKRDAEPVTLAKDIRPLQLSKEKCRKNPARNWNLGPNNFTCLKDFKRLWNRFVVVMIRIQFWENSQKVAVLRVFWWLSNFNKQTLMEQCIFVWSWINTNEIKWRISFRTIDASMTFICYTGDADMSAHATWPQGWLGYRFDVGWDQVPYIAGHFSNVLRALCHDMPCSSVTKVLRVAISKPHGLLGMHKVHRGWWETSIHRLLGIEKRC